jgi:glutathione S-transferase
MRLHQWEISPFCTKVRKILDMKGFAYEKVNYNGLEARKAAKLTPTGKLPVLEHGDQLIQDSAKIAAYLEDIAPDPPIYPASDAEKARAHFWEDWAGESLYWFEVYFRFGPYPEASEQAFTELTRGRPGFERLLMKMIAGPSMRRQLKQQGIGRQSREQVEARFFAHLEALNTELGDRQWLVGNQRTIADIAVTAQLDEILRTSHLRDQILKTGNLKDWLVRNDSAFI